MSVNKSDNNSIMFSYRDHSPDAVSFDARKILSTALESAAQNDAERLALKKYQETIRDSGENAKKAKEIRAYIKDLETDQEGNSDELIAERNRLKIYQDRIARADKRLLELQAMQPIKALLKRETEKAYKLAEERRARQMEGWEKRHRDTQLRSNARTFIKAKVKRLSRILNTESPVSSSIPLSLGACCFGLSELFANDSAVIDRDSLETLVFSYEALLGKCAAQEHDRNGFAYSSLYHEIDDNVLSTLQAFPASIGGKPFSDLNMVELSAVGKVVQYFNDLIDYVQASVKPSPQNEEESVSNRCSRTMTLLFVIALITITALPYIFLPRLDRFKPAVLIIGSFVSVYFYLTRRESLCLILTQPDIESAPWFQQILIRLGLLSKQLWPSVLAVLIVAVWTRLS